ncbi:hypothetical protein F8O53_08990 [Enterobacter sp. 63]
MANEGESCVLPDNFAPFNRRAQCTISGSGKALNRSKSHPHHYLNTFIRPFLNWPRGSLRLKLGGVGRGLIHRLRTIGI